MSNDITSRCSCISTVAAIRKIRTKLRKVAGSIPLGKALVAQARQYRSRSAVRSAARAERRSMCCELGATPGKPQSAPYRTRRRTCGGWAAVYSIAGAAPPGDAQQVDTGRPDRARHRLDVLHIVFRGKFGAIPIGQPAAVAVVQHDRTVSGEWSEERADPRRASPPLQVTDETGRNQQDGPAAQDGVGGAGAVHTLRIADVERDRLTGVLLDGL